MNKTKEVVLKKIKRDEIKMRPKWQFWARRTGAGGSLGLLILAGSILAAGTTYLIEAQNPRELLGYGSLGWEILIEGFPYLFLAGTIVLVLASVSLYSKTGDNYKKTTRRVVATTTGIIIILTLMWWLLKTLAELELLLLFI